MFDHIIMATYYNIDFLHIIGNADHILNSANIHVIALIGVRNTITEINHFRQSHTLQSKLINLFTIGKMVSSTFLLICSILTPMYISPPLHNILFIKLSRSISYIICIHCTLIMSTCVIIIIIQDIVRVNICMCVHV